ncbi:MAG TPA: hypothetical protein VGJ16_01380 [Pirellulales bacterium]
MTIKAARSKIGVKEAVQSATSAIKELLAPDSLSNLRLEEVEQTDDERYWLITLGFDDPTAVESLMGPLARATRKYKVFTVDAETGKVRAMKIRSV